MQFFSIAKAYRTTIIKHLDAAGHLSDTAQSVDGSGKINSASKELVNLLRHILR